MAANDYTTEAQAEALATSINNSLGVANTERGDLAALNTTAKDSLVAAINENSTNAGVAIDDTTASGTTTYSGSKIDADIAAARASLVDSSPEMLDTLNELSAALGDDANFAATTSTAIGNRIRYDEAQTLSAPQQTQAQSNIGIVASSVDLAGLITN